MKSGYARVSTDGQSVDAQVAALSKHGAAKVVREVASGAKTDRAKLRRLLDQLDAGDVLMVTRLDRPSQRGNRGALFEFGASRA
jgi:DNA invertase Pin-like site-specific DNA recombinase